MKLLTWVSTYDSLPDYYENVIVCYRSNVGDDGWSVGEGYFDEYGKCYVLSERPHVSNDREVKVVCAWMNLPPQPRVAFLRRSHFVKDKTKGKV